GRAVRALVGPTRRNLRPGRRECEADGVKKALVVAKWEFLTTVTRGGYIFAVVAMPLFYGGMFMLAGLAGRSAATSSSRTPVAIVDRAHVIDLSFAAERASERERSRQHELDGMTVALARRSPAGANVITNSLSPTAELLPYDDLTAALSDL